MDAPAPPFFTAVITPHRSLSPRGLGLLFAMIAILSLLVGLRFWLLGAWPVALFAALEIALAGGFFWLNHRAARAVELVTIDEREARVIQNSAFGRRRDIRLPTAWLRVALDDPANRVPRLFLCERAWRAEIGAALGAEAKRDLARSLAEALHAWRHPRFDNPQLG
jgi:uncharacterized membrane protein